jgi:hypothetical protein
MTESTSERVAAPAGRIVKGLAIEIEMADQDTY